MLSRDPSSPTIALAENNRADLRLLLSALRRTPTPLNIDILRDGEEVLRYFYGNPKRAVGGYRENPCNLLLLKLALPKLDGFKVLRQLQWLYREDLTRLPPIVVLCESDDPEMVAHAYRFGAKGFLCSAIPDARLVRAVEDVLHYWFEVTLRPQRGSLPPQNRERGAWPATAAGIAQQELVLR